MDTKRTILILLIVSIVSWIGGYLLTNSYNFGFCYANFQTNTFDVSCHDSFERVGNALFYGSGALALIFLTLLFIPQAFPAWKKFAVWFVPLVALLFIVYPNPGSGDLFSPYPEQVFRWVSGLYVTISLLIIAVKYISLRKS